VTTDEMGCTTASTERIKTLVVGLQNIRMTCQAKVIIAAKTGDMIAVENNFGALRRKKACGAASAETAVSSPAVAAADPRGKTSTKLRGRN